jgi:hypothetical protein
LTGHRTMNERTFYLLSGATLAAALVLMLIWN